MKLFFTFVILAVIFFTIAIITSSLICTLNGTLYGVFAIIRIKELNAELDKKLAELKTELAELEKK